ARGYDGFAAADRAVRALRRNSRHIGINCVLTRENFDQLGELFRYAKRRRLRSIELLRMKPTGRGAAAYDRLRCTAAQHEALLPTVLGLVRRHRIRVRLDCSLTPFIACHRPPRRLVEWLGIRRCIGGAYLVAPKAQGASSACSFAAPPAGGPSVGALAPYWRQHDAFEPFRSWRNGPEPCRSCEYLSLCRGGCRAVSASPTAPDPECPLVLAAATQKTFRKEGASPSAQRNNQLFIVGP